MNKEEKVKKGQKVYVTGDKELQECTVKSSGSKYITLEELYNIKFDASTLRQIGSYGVARAIILDVEAYHKEQMKWDIVDKLRKVEWENLGLDKLLDIYNQLEEEDLQ